LAKTFHRIIEIVDVAAVLGAFVCCVMIIQIDYYESMLRFAEGFFVFVTERSDFDDDFALKIVGNLK